MDSAEDDASRRRARSGDSMSNFETSFKAANVARGGYESERPRASQDVMSRHLRTLVVAPAERTFVQLFRYTFVGGTAFLVDIGILFALTSVFHVYYLISAAVAFVVGVTVNYVLSIAWVFSSRSTTRRFVEFTVFASVGVVGLGLNETIMWFFTGALGLFYLYSKIISAAVVYLFNFAARKALLFR